MNESNELFLFQPVADPDGVEERLQYRSDWNEELSCSSQI